MNVMIITIDGLKSLLQQGIFIHWFNLLILQTQTLNT